MNEKYDQAYIDLLDENVTLTDLKMCYSENRAEYKKTYQGHLLCPDSKCHKVKLTLVNGKYLRGYPDQEHTDNCPYRLPYLTEQEITEALQEGLEKSKNGNQIRGRMWDALYSLLPHETPETNNTEAKERIEKQERVIKRNRSVLRKNTPVRKMTTRYGDSDFTETKIHYGEARFKYNEEISNDKNKRVIIHMVSVNTDEEYMKIAMNANVFYYVNKVLKQERIQSGAHVYIAVVARLTKAKIGAPFANIKHSEDIIVCLPEKLRSQKVV